MTEHEPRPVEQASTSKNGLGRLACALGVGSAASAALVRQMVMPFSVWMYALWGLIFVTAVVALVAAWNARRAVRAGLADNRGTALVGVVAAWLSIAWIAFGVFVVVFMAMNGW
ncbi:hypothetical protein [Antribacter gilvus]|uniref:hypothetical protein n=1 Tax=Antribacter gilvus TaxID=2304675 RepID=UPI000F7A3ECC|nr:hypothetical protein [Antribacter gilvus]